MWISQSIYTADNHSLTLMCEEPYGAQLDIITTVWLDQLYHPQLMKQGNAEKSSR